MELTELTNLIHIREFTYNAINNMSIDKSVVKHMIKTLQMLDKKICSIIQDKEFQEYIKPPVEEPKVEIKSSLK